jgi:hypothetical protein
MRISVLIEPVTGNKFRATGGSPLGLTAEGATREAALEKLRELIDERVAHGAEIISIDLPEFRSEHPWLLHAGMFQGDPLVEEWKQAMAEYRRLADSADPGPDVP